MNENDRDIPARTVYSASPPSTPPLPLQLPPTQPPADAAPSPPPVDNAFTGTGYLRLAVRTADGAIPLEGALVTLRRGNNNGANNANASAGAGASAGGNTGTSPNPDGSGGNAGGAIASFLTDRVGLTPIVSLPAPPRSLSQDPGNNRPFAVYDADVSLEGYSSNLYVGIPVFDGITSMQTVLLIPLPENGRTDEGLEENVINYSEPREDPPGEVST